VQLFFRSILVWLFLLLTFVNSYSQERLGLTTSNYSGVNGVWLNPSSIVNYRQYLDINVASGGFSVDNDYLYIDKSNYKVSNVLSLSPQLPVYTETHADLNYSVELGNFLHFQNTKTKDLNLDTRVNGLGFILVKGKFAYGFSTAARSVLSVKNVPESVANFGYIGLNYVPQHNIEYGEGAFSAGAMAWTEYGFSFAAILDDIYYNKVSLGITMKYLKAWSGFYLNGDNITYNMLDGETLDIRNMNATVGMSLPLDYATNDFPAPGNFFKGQGLSMDLGITFLKKDNNYLSRDFSRICEQHFDTYIYKFGISLLDIGFVQFNDNAVTHQYSNAEHYWPQINSYQYEDMNYLMGDLSTRFTGDSEATIVSNKVTMYTPAAISVQGDVAMDNNIFLNAVWIQPLVLGKGTLSRPAQAAFIPRYERRNFEVAIPFSLYQYQYPRVGLSIRAYWLTIGTEKLGAFTGLTDFTGLDIYFSVKFSFEKGRCPGVGRKYGCESVRFK